MSDDHPMQTSQSDLLQSLLHAGLKVTAPRMQILQLFDRSLEKHLTAEEVFRRMLAQQKNASVATVYRTLVQFAEAGLLLRTQFDSGAAIFELDRGVRHGHLVCKRCGGVEEFVNPEIVRHQQETAAARGFELHDHALSLYGVCAACRVQKGDRPAGAA